jgi:hypothetical protein
LEVALRINSLKASKANTAEAMCDDVRAFDCAERREIGSADVLIDNWSY